MFRSRFATRWFGRLVGATILMVVLSSANAQLASAHSQLISSEPPGNATITAPLQEVKLTFNENIQSNFAVVKVIAPSGNELELGQPEVQGNVLTETVSNMIESGMYTLSYRIVSADGHPIAGEQRFTYQATDVAPSPQNQTAEPATIDETSSFWSNNAALVAALGLLLIVLLALAVSKFVRRTQN